LRVLRIALAGLIGLAAVLIGAPAAFAAGAQIGTNPTHGTANAQFTIGYQAPTNGNGGCQGNQRRVLVSWDGIPVGQIGLDRRTCTAQGRMRPPNQDRGVGRHTISAVVLGRDGSQASATYTIDGANTAKTTAPTTSPTAAKKSPTAAPTIDTPAISDDDTPSSAPLVVEPPAKTPAVAASVAEPAIVSWALVIGSILVLGGAGIFGTMLVRSRRGRGDEPHELEDEFR
jgi:hypothetical protein